jgi:hypothetical protein
MVEDGWLKKYVPSASMTWIRLFGSSAARSSQSRIVGHPVQLLVVNILEMWGVDK